jgi:predicted membrane chloride channel (bestrophin family)
MGWLFCLPVALDGQAISRAVKVGTLAAAAFILLGLDEIGVQIEQPFRIMPMQALATNAFRDVADAYVCKPPSLDDVNDESHNDNMKVKPGYW